MFGRKKEAALAPPRRKGAELLSEMGMGGPEEFGDTEDNADLEAELLALEGKVPVARKRGAKGPVNASDFDIMVANSLKNIEDEEVSDTEDPDLLNELQELEADGSPPPSPEPSSPKKEAFGGTGIVCLLEERLQNYQQALENTKSAGDMSKQKRTERGIKMIEDLLKKAKQGKPIDEDDIPPTVAVTTLKQPQQPPPIAKQASSVPELVSIPPKVTPIPKPAPRMIVPLPAKPEAVAQPGKPAAVTQSEGSSSVECSMLIERRDQYKKAALLAKHGGDISAATNFVKIAKQFDAVIAAMKAGNAVDLSKMPPPPPQICKTSQISAPATMHGPTKSEHTSFVQLSSEAVTVPPPPSEEEERKIFQAPDAPKTVLEALNQRLDKYKNAEQQAKEEGNDSKMRRMCRITKQYQEAIRDFKAGRQVDFEELPTPPGYAPIPIGPVPKQVPASSPSTSAMALQMSSGHALGQKSPQPQPVSKSPQPQKSPSTSQSQTSVSSRQQSQQADGAGQKVLKRSASTRQDQQITFLKERMQEYKVAAVNAKKNNDIALAKQYLRIAKGFEPMIDAAESGLPVDMSQLPPPLDTDNDGPSFVMVSTEECEVSGDRNEVFEKLKQDLISQIGTCSANSSHFTKLGDVINANKFQKMGSGLKKDLDALNSALSHNDPVPKFHYENRTFSMVQCNTDLGDNDLEMTIIRGLQYNPPSGYLEKDLDTFVKYEFPFPTEEPQLGHSETAKGSFNPEYQQVVKLQMNRKARALVRVIERKTIKLEIYYKRGLFKGDKLLGTVNVKLVPLETQCTVHESYDLTDGRKLVGGKLEVKLRIRDPFKSKQVEEVKEKWLVIDQFIKALDKPKSSTKIAQVDTNKGQQSAGTTCMEVLKYEKQQLDKQISGLKDSLSATQLTALTTKTKLLQQKIEQQTASLKAGGVEAWKEYVSVVDKDIQKYTDEAKQFAQHGDMQKAQLMLTKKKLAEKEVGAIRTKIPNI